MWLLIFFEDTAIFWYDKPLKIGMKPNTILHFFFVTHNQYFIMHLQIFMLK